MIMKHLGVYHIRNLGPQVNEFLFCLRVVEAQWTTGPHNRCEYGTMEIQSQPANNLLSDLI